MGNKKVHVNAVHLTGPCDKCDGDHHESACPHFRGKAREKHRDATERYNKKSSGGRSSSVKDDDNYVEEDDDLFCEVSSKEARVLSQPGDGNCLFHSLSHGVNSVNKAQRTALFENGGNITYDAAKLRLDLENYIGEHPDVEIGGTPLGDWVLWDSGLSTSA